jgi:hypothetical protein
MNYDSSRTKRNFGGMINQPFANTTIRNLGGGNSTKKRVTFSEDQSSMQRSSFGQTELDCAVGTRTNGALRRLNSPRPQCLSVRIQQIDLADCWLKSFVSA